MTDTHCHLNDERFSGDLKETIKRAFEWGVKRIVVVGYDIKSSEKAVRISEEFNGLYATVGLHPYEAVNYGEGDLKFIEGFLKHPKVVAVGEIGLDYFRGPDDKNAQKGLFIQQIEIAKIYKKPVVLHVRDAFEDVFYIVKKHLDVNFVFHSFSFGEEEMKKILPFENLYVSFSGMITFVKDVEKAAKISPKDRTLVDTDSPYLAPVPMRGKRNEPAFVKFVVEKLAKIWGISFEECEKITDENARGVMGFS
ncbi:MAG: TatD family hydrolase [candidate division WOR-3 bacterium]